MFNQGIKLKKKTVAKIVIFWQSIFFPSGVCLIH